MENWLLYLLTVVIGLGFISVVRTLRNIHDQLDLYLGELAERAETANAPRSRA
jgi:hypothetical protein